MHVHFIIFHRVEEIISNDNTTTSKSSLEEMQLASTLKVSQHIVPVWSSAPRDMSSPLAQDKAV